MANEFEELMYSHKTHDLQNLIEKSLQKLFY